ncbi:MAG: TIGR03118 family protein, partial [Gaiellaceae bacterium]
MTYAKQNAAAHDELNSPWGLARAPSTFGRFAGDLLVGNFGDGTINAYEELSNGHFEHRGQLRTGDGKPVTIDGLWAL